jgi:hypothetical protein
VSTRIKFGDNSILETQPGYLTVVTYLVAHFLLEDGPILLVAAAAGEQSWKQETRERRVAEIWKRQVAQLLKNRGHVPGLDHHLKSQQNHTL